MAQGFVISSFSLSCFSSSLSLHFLNLDVDQSTNINKNPLHIPNGSITKFDMKTLKEALNRLASFGHDRN